MFYNGQKITKLYLGSTELTKLYYQGNVVVESYDVTDDITTYTDRTYVDVYDMKTSKWYKLNNLNQYEAYGIYAESLDTTTYDGKLAVIDAFEYKYTNGAWSNIGAAASKPISKYLYTSVMQADKRHYINTGIYPTAKTVMIINGLYVYTSGVMCGYGPNDTPATDSSDYRLFSQGDRIYWDCNAGRIDTSFTKTGTSEFNVEVGNNYIKGQFCDKTLNIPSTVQTQKVTTVSIKVNPTNVKVKQFQIYDDGILKFDGYAYSGTEGTGLWDKLSNKLYTNTDYSYSVDDYETPQYIYTPSTLYADKAAPATS